MNVVNVKLPLTIANLGVPLKFLDTSSFFTESLSYVDNLYKTQADKEYLELTLEQPYAITRVDVIGQEVSVAILEDYYERLLNAGVLGTVSVAFLCDLSPNIVNPLWTVNSVKTHYLAVTAQVVADDFLNDVSEVLSEESEEVHQVSIDEIESKEE